VCGGGGGGFQMADCSQTDRQEGSCMHPFSIFTARTASPRTPAQLQTGCEPKRNSDKAIGRKCKTKTKTKQKTTPTEG
jgi:hypothetical protein